MRLLASGVPQALWFGRKNAETSFYTAMAITVKKTNKQKTKQLFSLSLFKKKRQHFEMLPN